MNNNDGFDKLWCKYDIAGGKKRLRKVAKECQNHAQRVQNSVFEADLDYSSFLKLKEKLMDLIDKEEDSLRFYYLGNNWERRVEHIGAKKTYNPEGVIIIWFLNETGELLVIKKIQEVRLKKIRFNGKINIILNEL